MRIVGLDLSLSGTGCADTAGASVLSSRKRGLDRIAELRDEVLMHVRLGPRLGPIQPAADLVVIEDYAFSRAAAHAHELGELGGVVKLALVEAGFTVVLVGPSSVKKFATGRGNSDKLGMAIAASKAGYDGPEQADCIDAWWLRQMGLYALGLPCSTPQTAYRDEACSKVLWPAVEAAS